MRRHNRTYSGGARSGATILECAFILPVTFFIMLALVVGSIGVFRYQEVAVLAREGARYASTHGYQYRRDSGLPLGEAADWRQDIIDNAILPMVIGLDPSALEVEVDWPDVINQPGKPDNWPGSRVTVTVSYLWMPEWGSMGPIRLSSTSSMPITN
jgi:Flp pilus assembly protein TadG